MILKGLKLELQKLGKDSQCYTFSASENLLYHLYVYYRLATYYVRYCDECCYEGFVKTGYRKFSYLVFDWELGIFCIE